MRLNSLADDGTPDFGRSSVYGIILEVSDADSIRGTIATHDGHEKVEFFVPEVAGVLDSARRFQEFLQ